VLLDVPRLRDVPWLEPGEHAFRADLEGAERAQGVTVADGDILLVRTGHSRRLAELGPWDTPKAKAGLHPTAVTFLADRHISVLGSDGNSDTAPSTTEGIDFPIHVDPPRWACSPGLPPFEDLAAVCERERRWEFLFVGAPLRVVDGTARPINPIAVF
jgi:kynurenine formamidase